MVSINADIPEPVFNVLAKHLKEHKATDQNVLVTGAIASFLMQSGCSDKAVVEAYMEAIAPKDEV